MCITELINLNLTNCREQLPDSRNEESLFPSICVTGQSPDSTGTPLPSVFSRREFRFPTIASVSDTGFIIVNNINM